MKALLANQAALRLTSESVPDIFSVHNAMLSIPTELKGYEQIARCKKIGGRQNSRYVTGMSVAIQGLIDD